MRPILLIRPQPGADRSADQLRAHGVPAQVSPLFAVRPLGWAPPPAEQFHALVAGSANVFRHAGSTLQSFTSLPVYAVGQRTADAAREAGFEVAAVGAGTLQDVVRRLESDGRTRVLYLAGRDRKALQVPKGLAIETIPVYVSEKLPMPDSVAAALTEVHVVPLFSPRAARHFESQCRARGIATDIHRAACMSPDVRSALACAWDTISIADTPDANALLAVAMRMCQE